MVSSAGVPLWLTDIHGSQKKTILILVRVAFQLARPGRNGNFWFSVAGSNGARFHIRIAIVGFKKQ